jgi:hypothetical protein
MTRASFRQADIERIIRAARNAGAVVNIDIRTLVCTIVPTPREVTPSARVSHLAPDGPEDWDDEAPPAPDIEPFDHRESSVIGHLAERGANVRVRPIDLKTSAQAPGRSFLIEATLELPISKLNRVVELRFGSLIKVSTTGRLSKTITAGIHPFRTVLPVDDSAPSRPTSAS